jgi:hypothetical protein
MQNKIPPTFLGWTFLKLSKMKKPVRFLAKKTRVTIMVRRLFVKNQFGCIIFFGGIFPARNAAPFFT